MIHGEENPVLAAIKNCTPSKFLVYSGLAMKPFPTSKQVKPKENNSGTYSSFALRLQNQVQMVMCLFSLGEE
jgi:hypothetical protein